MEKTAETMGRVRLLFYILFRLIMILCIFYLLLAVCAGNFNWARIWIWLTLFFGSSLPLLVWLYLKRPDLLLKRVSGKETDKNQRFLVLFFTPVFIAAFLLLGLDERFSWSDVPFWLELVGGALLVLGIALYSAVLYYNRFAGRTIQVDQGQTVISTGPYAVVRHPLYLSGLMVLAGTPLVLDSLWGFGVFTTATIVLYALRIVNEEKLLARELPGYSEYIKTVRWRLFPGVW